MKVYVVAWWDDECECVSDIEAVFTDINKAAKCFISHKTDRSFDHLRIIDFECDDVDYINNAKPKKIVWGSFSKVDDEFYEKPTTYDYYHCEELIEQENCVKVSTTVPIEMKDEEAYGILRRKYREWKELQKEV